MARLSRKIKRVAGDLRGLVFGSIDILLYFAFSEADASPLSKTKHSHNPSPARRNEKRKIHFDHVQHASYSTEPGPFSAYVLSRLIYTPLLMSYPSALANIHTQTHKIMPCMRGGGCSSIDELPKNNRPNPTLSCYLYSKPFDTFFGFILLIILCVCVFGLEVRIGYLDGRTVQ